MAVLILTMELIVSLEVERMVELWRGECAIKWRGDEGNEGVSGIVVGVMMVEM